MLHELVCHPEMSNAGIWPVTVSSQARLASASRLPAKQLRRALRTLARQCCAALADGVLVLKGFLDSNPPCGRNGIKNVGDLALRLLPPGHPGWALVRAELEPVAAHYGATLVELDRQRQAQAQAGQDNPGTTKPTVTQPNEGGPRSHPPYCLSDLDRSAAPEPRQDLLVDKSQAGASAAPSTHRPVRPWVGADELAKGYADWIAGYPKTIPDERNAFRDHARARRRGVLRARLVRGLGIGADPWRAERRPGRMIPMPWTWLRRCDWSPAKVSAAYGRLCRRRRQLDLFQPPRPEPRPIILPPPPPPSAPPQAPVEMTRRGGGAGVSAALCHSGGR